MDNNSLNNKKHIRQFKCQNCGGELELKNTRSTYVSCPYCGSVADTSSDAYKILTQHSNPSHFPTRTFLKVGLTGTISGLKYYITSRTCWQSKYKEFWREDGETGYSDESWTFDEWLLLCENGTYMTIIEDSEGFYISKQTIPFYPNLPSGTEMQHFFENKQMQVSEYGQSKVLHFEGESTYLVKPGETVSFSEYNDKGKAYNAEWRFDENNAIKEIEFFEEFSVPYSQIYNAFKENPEVAAAQPPARRTSKPKGSKLNRRIMFFAGLICFLLSIFLYKDYTYKDLYKFSYTLNDLAKKHNWKTLNDSMKYISFTENIPIQFKKEQKSIYIKFIADIDTSSECLMNVYLLNKTNDTVFKANKYFYQYNKGDTLKAENIYAYQENFIVDVYEPLKFHTKLATQKDWTPTNHQTDIIFQVTERKPGYSTVSLTLIGLLMMVISIFIRRK